MPHYVVFNKRDSSLRYFQLRGDRYEEQPIGASNPRLWIPELEIGLAIWIGTFEGLPQAWLRWCDASGAILPTDTEAALQREAEAERLREQAEQQRQQAERQQQQAERQRQQATAQMRQTVLNLLKFGLQPKQVAELTGLSSSEIEAIASDS